MFLPVPAETSRTCPYIDIMSLNSSLYKDGSGGHVLTSSLCASNLRSKGIPIQNSLHLILES